MAYFSKKNIIAYFIRNNLCNFIAYKIRNNMKVIAIKNTSSIPKYMQIVDSILVGIQSTAIQPGEKLPSLYDLCVELGVSKRTVERAYTCLKKKQVIGGVHGKGHYVNLDQTHRGKKVLMMVNKYESHHKFLYDSFLNHLQTGFDNKQVTVDLFVYNNDFSLCQSLLLNQKENYDHYVVIPYFKNDSNSAVGLLNELPKEKLTLLEIPLTGVTGNYSAITQDFRYDLTQSLIQLLPRLQKFTSLNLLLSDRASQTEEIKNGFISFCKQQGFKSCVVREVNQLEIQPANVYICFNDEDLVTLIKIIKTTSLKVGKQIGILAYHDSPMKEILLDGITVLSSDYEAMGRTAANMILNNQCFQIRNPYKIIFRNSL